MKTQPFVADWEAMKTTFRLRICGLPEDEARSLATDCFHLLMELEQKLSRFAEGGEVWRINRLATGEVLHISEETHRCLVCALEGWRTTGGVFDVTLGKNINRLKEGLSVEAENGKFAVDPARPVVVCEMAGKEIDLGGIGKGFALDQMKRVIEEWGASGGLLCAGNSTLLAFGEDEWPVSIGGEVLSLRRAALSSSGTGIQGNHIIHPADMGPPEYPRAWAIADHAACAEIWSTAALLMTPEEIREIAPQALGLLSVWLEIDGRPVAVWKNSQGG